MKNWIRLGIAVVVLAVFSIGAAEVFRRHPEYHARRKIIAGVIAGAGTLIWLAARAHAKTDPDYIPKDNLITLRFCGSLLAACGGIVTNISQVQQIVSSPSSFMQIVARENKSGPKSPAAAGESSSSSSSSLSSSSSSSSSSSGGRLKVQGIIYNPKDPSAIINGKTVFVGDRVGQARVVAIERTSVTIQLAEEKLVLALR